MLAVFNPRFLNPDTTGLLAYVILCCGGCSVHFRMFNSFADFYQDASETLYPDVTTKKYLQTLANVSQEVKLPTVENQFSLEGNCVVFLNRPSRLGSWSNTTWFWLSPFLYF